jgi:hypothetical protein
METLKAGSARRANYSSPTGRINATYAGPWFGKSLASSYFELLATPSCLVHWMEIGLIG